MILPNSPSAPDTASPKPQARAVAIVGPSGSGKTELICRLLAWYETQGLQVAVLKHTHKQELGDTGKDTWRFRQAGARLVAISAPGLLQITRRSEQEIPLEAVLPDLAAAADLVLVEGYKQSLLPKIAFIPPGEPVPSHPHTIALVSALPLTASLPVFQPDQVEALGTFILQYLNFPW